MSNTEQVNNQSHSELGFGATVLERLLLAIIDAHSTASSETRQQRLNAAMKALVGSKAAPHPLYDNVDDAALRFMAH